MPMVRAATAVRRFWSLHGCSVDDLVYLREFPVDVMRMVSMFDEEN